MLLTLLEMGIKKYELEVWLFWQESHIFIKTEGMRELAWEDTDPP